MTFPRALHICTYDVRGTLVASGVPKRTRETGLVEHTHQLLRGLSRRRPGTRLDVTYTGGSEPQPATGLRTPEGQQVTIRQIATRFPEYLTNVSGQKCPIRVMRYYEDGVDDVANPVWRSLAEQYTRAVTESGTGVVLAQNINPSLHCSKRFGTGC
ncbi:hypothetical protein ACFVUW_10625 [Streptomyces xiamenensis]|uniref:hypothetical protein n=1 Tax=Streptomyces xiamenensis TaxID=408015 RepID=UPI0036EABDB0